MDTQRKGAVGHNVIKTGFSATMKQHHRQRKEHHCAERLDGTGTVHTGSWVTAQPQLKYMYC